METLPEAVENFFDAYAKRFNSSLHGADVDVEGTVDSFANCFVEASPVGITCGKNDNEFRNNIPKGYDFYRNIGTRSMTISKKEITILNDLHAMVKIHWDSEYQKKDGNKVLIDFDVFYFVQRTEKGIKIFAYITGDEQKVLKEHGLI